MIVSCYASANELIHTQGPGHHIMMTGEAFTDMPRVWYIPRRFFSLVSNKIKHVLCDKLFLG